MQNDDTINAKNAKKNICNKCNFKCSKQSDYYRHTMTAKHKMMHNVMLNGDVKPAKNATQHVCICGRSYAYRQGLDRHKKNCSLSREPSPRPLASLNAELYSNSIVISENPEEKPSIMDFITQSKEIMDILVLQNKEQAALIKEQSVLNKEQANTIRELIPKIGSNNNNNNTITANNQFNLNTFLNEDCKDALNFSDFIETIKVSFEDLENQAENGYIKGISKLFIENLQGLGMNKRPIHCSDKKRKTLYIKENDEWDKEGSQDTIKKGIQEITRRTMIALMKEKEDRPEEYSDMDSDFSMKCINIQRNLTPVMPRETSFSKVVSNISDNTIIGGNDKTIE
jgi:hypothetical protein